MLQAGTAAQAKRKKRRVSIAFSEMLAGLSDKKEGGTAEDDEQESREGEGQEARPRRIKRLKSCLSGWFGVQKREE